MQMTIMAFLLLAVLSCLLRESDDSQVQFPLVKRIISDFSSKEYNPGLKVKNDKGLLEIGKYWCSLAITLRTGIAWGECFRNGDIYDFDTSGYSFFEGKYHVKKISFKNDVEKLLYIQNERS